MPGKMALFMRFFSTFFDSPICNERNEDQTTKGEPNAVENEGTNVFHAHALGNKCEPPDG